MHTVHKHYFQGPTDQVLDHHHRYYGKSSGAANFAGHLHQLSSCTTKDDNHRHYLAVVTGPSIEIPGGHIHSYQGFTSCDLNHCHSLSGNTLTENFMPSARTSFTANEAKEIGKYLGINWQTSSFNIDQFRAGLDVELEHGKRDPATNVTDDDPITTGKIALAHLNEFPDYYTRLTKLEKEAKTFWKK